MNGCSSIFAGLSLFALGFGVGILYRIRDSKRRIDDYLKERIDEE